jgi:transposase
MMEQDMATSKAKEVAKLEVVQPDAAGVDVGGSSHHVAIRSDAPGQTVREFGCFTKDLHEMADWLLSSGVKIVALESTGVYWIPVFEVLERRGLEVLLVHASYVKNVSGRKSDVLDCQWLQRLLSFGLLRGGISTAGPDVRTARAQPVAYEAAARAGQERAAHAEGADGDERPVDQRDQ